MSNYQIRRHERFNDSTAETNVWYTLWYKHFTFFRKRIVWKPIQTGYMDMRFPIKGDIKWANKIAKHYGIKVPKK